MTFAISILNFNLFSSFCKLFSSSEWFAHFPPRPFPLFVAIFFYISRGFHHGLYKKRISTSIGANRGRSFVKSKFFRRMFYLYRLQFRALNFYFVFKLQLRFLSALFDFGSARFVFQSFFNNRSWHFGCFAFFWNY